MKKIKWQYGIYIDRISKKSFGEEKIWHFDDGCYKIIKEDGKFILSVGWHIVGRFRKLGNAKKVAELIYNK